MNVETLMSRASRLETEGARKKAIKAYAVVLEQEPDNGDAFAAIERLLAHIKSPARALAIAERLGVVPEAVARLRSLADRLAGAPDLDDPESFAQALRATPDDPALRARIGRVLGRGGAELPMARELEDVLVREPLPTHIRIETASTCNLRCQHCTTGVDYKGTDRRVMAMETFERVLDQVRTLPTLHTAIMYLGGEPLLNKHHATMCRRVKEETGITTVKFVTNAMMLTERWCQEIAAARVDGIHISVDGRSPEENDRIRVGASYPVVRDNIRMLQRVLAEAGCRTRISLGNMVFRQPGDLLAPQTPAFLREDFPDLKITTGYAMVWPGMTAEQTSLDDLSVYQEKPRGFCDHPFYDIAVRANGDLILCCYDISGQHVMGNILTDDLLPLYRSEAYQDIRRAMLRHDGAAVPPICQRCVNFTGDRFIQNPMRV